MVGVDAVLTYVVLPKPMARAAALWVVGSHAFFIARVFPRLLIKAPDSECGKSTLKGVLAPLVTTILLAAMQPWPRCSV